MALPNALKYEKKLDLGNNLAIYEAHQDSLREQAKNARVMSPDKFARLVANISNDKRLESLPLCVMKKSQDGESAEFHIISGHHRLRAARKAEISSVYILVDESELTEDQIKSKQLSHNSLNGEDDPQLLKELFESIETIDNKIMSGLTDTDFDIIKGIKSPIEEIKIDISYEFLSIAFLPSDFDKWNEIMPMLQKEQEKNYVANVELFPQFKDQVREVFERENIRNINSALVKMLDIVKEYYENKPIINNEEGEQTNGEEEAKPVEEAVEQVAEEKPEEATEPVAESQENGDTNQATE